jgi:hypothetical protein
VDSVEEGTDPEDHVGDAVELTGALEIPDGVVVVVDKLVSGSELVSTGPTVREDGADDEMFVLIELVKLWKNVDDETGPEEEELGATEGENDGRVYGGGNGTDVVEFAEGLEDKLLVAMGLTTALPGSELVELTQTVGDDTGVPEDENGGQSVYTGGYGAEEDEFADGGPGVALLAIGPVERST